MMRPFTAICMLAAAGSGFYLFQTKNTSMMLDREIARIMKQTDQARERTGLLRAEYARLTGPGPIGELAAQLLPELKATQPTQYAAMADLDRRLPAIGAPPPAQPLEPQAPDALPPRPERIEPARIDPPKTEAPKAPAIAALPPRAPLASTPAPVPLPVPQPAPTLAQTTLAPAAPKPPAPKPAPQFATVPQPAPAPQAPPVVTQAAAPMVQPPVHAPARSALASATNPPAAAPSALGRAVPVALRAPPATPAEAIARIARGEPVNPSVPAVASALGMARTMTPSALASAQAATIQPGSLR
jgi:hypothetical protein